MSGVEFDFTEVNELAAILEGVPNVAADNVRKALQVTSTNVKEEWRRAANRTNLGQYSGDVTYETKVSKALVSAEIGPTADGDGGSLGIVEDAPGGVRSAPQHAGRDAARRNEKDFVKGVLIAAAEPLED